MTNVYLPTFWVDEDGSGNGTVMTAALMNKIERAVEAITWAIAANAQSVPTVIPADTVFMVPADTQMTFSYPIDVEGELVLEGALVEVQ